VIGHRFDPTAGFLSDSIATDFADGTIVKQTDSGQEENHCSGEVEQDKLVICELSPVVPVVGRPCHCDTKSK